MPMGPTPVAFATFAGVKAVGYCGAAYLLSRAYRLDWNFLKQLGVGLARTGIGIVVGVTYGVFWMFLGGAMRLLEPSSTVLYFVLLAPLRMGEWYLLLWLFFDRPRRDGIRMWKYAGYGTGWSYVLDAFAVGAAIVVPGGIWVC